MTWGVAAWPPPPMSRSDPDGVAIGVRPTSAAPTAPASVLTGPTKEFCVPATSNRRRRLAAPLLGLLLVIVLAGCSAQRTPTSYTSGVQKAFIKGCTDTVISDNKTGTGTQVTKPGSYCTCVYAKIKKDVPFKDFKKINAQQTDKPAKLDPSFTKIYASCAPVG